jgi:hypothetical protein
MIKERILLIRRIRIYPKLSILTNQEVDQEKYYLVEKVKMGVKKESNILTGQR